MNIKKQVYEQLVTRLKADIVKLQHKRYENKYSIRKLAEEQVKIKQEQTVLIDLIRQLEDKAKTI